MGITEYLELEELVGKLWHRLITKGLEAPSYPEARVELESVARRLAVFFHGLGGERGVEIRPMGAVESHERKSWRERIGHVEKQALRARLDGDNLFLPPALDLFPQRRLNENLYFWLAAYSACAGEKRPPEPPDAFHRDLAFIHFAHHLAQRTMRLYPGTRPIYEELCAALLAARPKRGDLPEPERELEEAILALLGRKGREEEAGKRGGKEERGEAERKDGRKGEGQGKGGEKEQRPPSSGLLALLQAERLNLPPERGPRQYRPFMPVILWGDCAPALARSQADMRDEEDDEETLPGAAEEGSGDRTLRARRQKTDQAERGDPLLLYPFSGMLGWLEALNINRKVEDEDEETASKAADELDDIDIGKISKKPATRIKFDLDLAPEDVEHERLSGQHVYHEWDYREKSHIADHCRVLTRQADELPEGEIWEPEPESRRRIREVRRRFEALRPRRETFHRQLDGPEFDMDALVRSRCDLAASGEGSDNIYMQTRPHERDLAVSVLIDISRSTESWVEGRQIIDMEREALAALSLGLKASGDEHAIYAFSSVRRDRVYIQTIKSYEENVGPRVMSRIGALRPGFYTRMGAAIRHLASELEQRPNRHRLLLIITDGKPNDLDHYEGRYGIEDTRMAIIEARRSGLAVFGVTIDAKAQGYFPHMFGKGGYAIVPHPSRLTRALPLLFSHLVA
jgi:nitric oxide reductase NorD protein